MRESGFTDADHGGDDLMPALAYCSIVILMYLNTNGFLEKKSPGTYAPIDPLFTHWLKREYGEVDER